MPLCKWAWEAFMSHSEWREGCGRMLPLQRWDVITSPALPALLSWLVLSLLTFFSCHSPLEGDNHLLGIPRCAKANVPTLIWSRVNTDTHKCYAETEVTGSDNFSGQNGFDSDGKSGGKKDKIWKRSTRDKGTSWKSILENHATNPQLFLMTELK